MKILLYTLLLFPLTIVAQRIKMPQGMFSTFIYNYSGCMIDGEYFEKPYKEYVRIIDGGENGISILIKKEQSSGEAVYREANNVEVKDNFLVFVIDEVDNRDDEKVYDFDICYSMSLGEDVLKCKCTRIIRNYDHSGNLILQSNVNLKDRMYYNEKYNW